MLYLLDLFGTAVFAVAGALAAGRKRMDVFGVTVVALVTAIGGGTIRDMSLGARPVFWISDPLYLVIAGAAALATFASGAVVQHYGRLLLVADALGLAVFTAIGSQRAMDHGAPGLVVLVMGVMTGAAGGVVRDVLCNEVPLIFCREVYATASFAGAGLYWTLRKGSLGVHVATVAAMAVVFAIRLAAIHWRLALPVFHPSSDEASQSS